MSSRLRRRIASRFRSPTFRYALATAVVVLLCVLLLRVALYKGGLFDAARFNDFKAYHQAARAVLAGDFVAAYDHAERPYQYPPTLAALVAPIGLLPYRAGLAVWTLGSLAVLLLSLRALDEVLGSSVNGVDKFFGFLLAWRFFESDFANSNANTLVFGMVVAGFLLDRRGRAGFGGSLLALAACTKVTPILLLPWMVCGRRWRLLGGFLIGLVLWGAVVPGTVLGPASFAAGFGRWWSEMVTPLYSPQEAAPEAPAYVPGQSLRALCHRLLRDVDATAHDEDIVAVNVLALSPGAADGVYLGLSAVLFLGLLACFHRRGRAPAWGARELGVATLATVVFSPLARKAHFVVLFLAATAAFSNARAAHGRQRAAFAAAWGGAFALAVLSSPGALGAWLSKRVMAFCPLTFCALLLAFCLVQRPRPQHRDLNSPARF